MNQVKLVQFRTDYSEFHRGDIAMVQVVQEDGAVEGNFFNLFNLEHLEHLQGISVRLAGSDEEIQRFLNETFIILKEEVVNILQGRIQRLEELMMRAGYSSASITQSPSMDNRTASPVEIRRQNFQDILEFIRQRIRDAPGGMTFDVALPWLQGVDQHLREAGEIYRMIPSNMREEIRAYDELTEVINILEPLREFIRQSSPDGESSSGSQGIAPTYTIPEPFSDEYIAAYEPREFEIVGVPEITPTEGNLESDDEAFLGGSRRSKKRSVKKSRKTSKKSSKRYKKSTRKKRR